MSFPIRPWVWYTTAGLLAVVVLVATEADSPGEGKEPAKPGTGSVPMFGGSPARNMVNLVDRNILIDFAVRPKGKEKNVKWTAVLGNRSYGGPIITGGRVFIGTNNERPRDPKVRGDKGVMMCFREADGTFLWQIVHDKLESGEANDYPREGVASAPCVDGDRLYYVSNRCAIVCADVQGNEKTKKGKVLWTYDMVKELDVYPCQLANSSPVVVGDLVYALTGNGVDSHTAKLVKPKAAAFVAVNKNTGKLAWSSNLPGAKVMRGQWSNPTAATVNGKTQVIFAGGDGFLYGFEAKSGELIWKFDCNPKKATPYKPGGAGQKSFIIATPVVHDNRCYIAVGQEPDDGNGPGHLWCIDITKKPANKDRDLSPVGDKFDPKDPVNKDSGLVWHHGGMVMPKPKDDEREFAFGRTLSTVAVANGLVYAVEMSGYLQCLDAKTGKKYWENDFQESTWCSPYVVDGKVFVGTDAGELYVFKHGKTKNKLKQITIGGTIKVPPVACNGVLFVNSSSNLYAIAATK
jgi:outer membrane protein assembly factor BamB